MSDNLCFSGGVGKSCLTGKAPDLDFDLGSPLTYLCIFCAAQFVQNVWIESYDPTIEDSYRKLLEVDVSNRYLSHPTTNCSANFVFFPGSSVHARNVGITPWI